MEKQKVAGYIMAIIGLIMILINAAGYIFQIDISSPATSALGIVFVAVGTMNIRKYSK